MFEFFGGLILGIWRFLKFFFIRLYTATKFAIANYDSQLQMTKTPRQRIIIWSIIALISIGVVFLVLTLAGNFFLNSVHI